MSWGDEVHGHLHSADASSGLEVTIYKSGTKETRTIQPNEFLHITEFKIVTAAGGDTHFWIGTGTTPAAGETVVRGTFNSNGGIASQYTGTPFCGAKGSKPYASAPAGVLDVTFTGRVTGLSV